MTEEGVKINASDGHDWIFAVFWVAYYIYKYTGWLG